MGLEGLKLHGRVNVMMNQPHREKICFGVHDQSLRKQACSATEACLKHGKIVSITIYADVDAQADLHLRFRIYAQSRYSQELRFVSHQDDTSV